MSVNVTLIPAAATLNAYTPDEVREVYTATGLPIPMGAGAGTLRKVLHAVRDGKDPGYGITVATVKPAAAPSVAKAVPAAKPAQSPPPVVVQPAATVVQDKPVVQPISAAAVQHERLLSALKALSTAVEGVKLAIGDGVCTAAINRAYSLCRDEERKAAASLQAERKAASAPRPPSGPKTGVTVVVDNRPVAGPSLMDAFCTPVAIPAVATPAPAAAKAVPAAKPAQKADPLADYRAIKADCKAKGLPTHGTKAELLSRLSAHKVTSTPTADTVQVTLNVHRDAVDILRQLAALPVDTLAALLSVAK